ncbi:Hsp20/alpha crystallin family protein [Thalassoglobus neptunius]|uniref:Hsp20/alpha crystallin family protein n=1 Tax=Thalassoglobus neptunius TaxID=1938619 RepID=A0A5C5X4G9_9PLAN|nr:Hsp20/alpha crystallin family protein [Thalassoglobus neptunius]TWT57618.1 Hsp20/alpha crystallin family protein [Thalassoglobus neptunius]
MLTANRLHEMFRNSFDWNELLRMHAASTSQVMGPRVAVADTSVVVEFDLPGVQSSELDVEVEKNRLSLHVKKAEPSLGEGGQWKVREQGSLDQPMEFHFPFRIDAENSEVTLANGVLRATVRKNAEDSPVKLTVK